MKIKATPPLEGRLAKLLLAVGAVLFAVGILTVPIFYGVNFDEGYNLQIPRNIVEEGAYASNSSHGLVWFDPYISTGPLLLVPVAVSFRVLGDGIAQARLLSVGYAFLTLLATALLTRRLFGSLAAGIAVFLLASLDEAFVLLGMVLGEGAAVATLLLGMLLWSYAEEKQHDRIAVLAALGAGLLWGLSVWAKPSMAVALLFLFGGFGMAIVRKAPIRFLIPSLSVVAALTVAALWFLMPAAYFGLSGAMYQVKGASGLVSQQLDLGIVRNAVRNLPVFLVTLGGPILLGVLLARASSHRRIRLRFSLFAVCAVPLGWLAWWVLFNGSGDYRHLVPGLIVGIVPLSGSLAQLIRGQPHSMSRNARFMLVVLVVVSLVFSGIGLVDYFSFLRQAKDGKNRQLSFAKHIAGLEPDAKILAPGWFMAWDLAFLSGRQFARLGYDEDVPDGQAYLVITPTIQRYSGPYEASLGIVEDCSGKVVYEDPPYFRLYELETPCLRE